MPLLYSHQSQSDSRVPRSGFDDRHPWPEPVLVLRRLNDVLCDAIFDAPTGIQKLSLDKHIPRRQFVQANRRDRYLPLPKWNPQTYRPPCYRCAASSSTAKKQSVVEVPSPGPTLWLYVSGF